MKKKVLAGIMMAVMMMASVMGVSAAGSKTNEVSVSGESAKVYKTEVASDQSLKASADKVSDVSGKTAITAVYNLRAISGNGTTNAAGNYEVELEVAGLSSSCSNIMVLCYDEKAGTWSAVKVATADVDYTNKTIDVELPNLGPIVIYANVASGGSTGTSPSTVGTSSTWMVWAAVAIVALGAGVVATQKKSRS